MDLEYQGRTKYFSLPHPAARLVISHSVAEDRMAAEALEVGLDTIIYTDGSGLDDKIGAAFVARQSSNSSSFVHRKAVLGRACSVFQAELVAIRMALTWLKTKPCPIAGVFSDSLSSLLALEDRESVNPLVNEIKDLLVDLHQVGTAVKFTWVRAHVGIPGNELADKYAKEATTNRTSAVYTDFPLSFAKRHLRAKSLEAWKSRYESELPGSNNTKFFLKFFPRFDDLAPLWKMTPSFETSQVLTGHGLFKAYLLRFCLNEDSACPCGALFQTPPHLLFDCPALIYHRQSFLASCHSCQVEARDLPKVLAKEESRNAFIEFATNLVNSTRFLNSSSSEPLALGASPRH
jgi:ribonuclease HI